MLSWADQVRQKLSRLSYPIGKISRGIVRDGEGGLFVLSFLRLVLGFGVMCPLSLGARPPHDTGLHPLTLLLVQHYWRLRVFLFKGKDRWSDRYRAVSPSKLSLIVGVWFMSCWG